METMCFHPACIPPCTSVSLDHMPLSIKTSDTYYMKLFVLALLINDVGNTCWMKTPSECVMCLMRGAQNLPTTTTLVDSQRLGILGNLPRNNWNLNRRWVRCVVYAAPHIMCWVLEMHKVVCKLGKLLKLCLSLHLLQFVLLHKVDKLMIELL